MVRRLSLFLGHNGLMKRLTRVAASVVLALTAAGCSTMDNVNVSHACDDPVSVTVLHIIGSPGFTDRVDQATVAPNEVTTVTGIVNMSGDDLVHLTVDASGWMTELTRSELRDRDGLITLPTEACP